VKVYTNPTTGSTGTESDTEGEEMPIGTAQLLALAGTESSAGGATSGF
jgi:hypothetical protein